MTKVSETQIALHIKRTYHDFNHDGYSEQIDFNLLPSLNILIREKGNIISHKIVNGKVKLAVENVMYHDINNDGVDEIYFFSCYNDSVFFHGIEPYNTSNETFISLYIDKYVQKYETELDLSIESIIFQDQNKDGFCEAYFALHTGYSKQPRRLYCADIVKQEIYRSPLSGTVFMHPAVYDIDNDSLYEFVGVTSAFDNCSDFPYPDTTAWLMVFDDDLSFAFKPQQIGAVSSVLTYQPILRNDTLYYAVLHYYNGNLGIKGSLRLYDKNGKITDQPMVDFEDAGTKRFLVSTSTEINEYVLMLEENGNIIWYDNELHPFKKINYPQGGGLHPIFLDLNNNGSQEMIVGSHVLGDYIILSDNLTHLTYWNTANTTKILDISICDNGNSGRFTHIQTTKPTNQMFSTLFRYEKDPLYVLRWFILLFFWVIIYFFISFYLKYIQNLKIVRSKVISELQITAVSNQLDPHFTLNTLNAIGSLYSTQDSEKADYYFGKFARLVKGVLMQADQIDCTLKEELDFVENYLEIQRFRMNKRFDYSIKLDANTDQEIRIPQSLIHTFVENAVKHGLLHRDAGGKLSVSISKQAKKTEIRVTDNGIGREEAKKHSKLSTGKGLKIIEKILQLYFGLTRRRIKFDIQDNYENNQPTGTTVLIQIPD